MNTQTELKNIIAISDLIFDNYDNPDYYYNIELAEDNNRLNYIYTRFYMDGEYNVVVVPIGVACEFFKDFEDFENYEIIKGLNPNNLIMLDLNDNYIYINEDIEELKKDIENYKNTLTKE